MRKSLKITKTNAPECACMVWKEGNEIELDFCPLHASADAMADILLKSVTYVTHGPKKVDVEQLLRRVGKL